MAKKFALSMQLNAQDNTSGALDQASRSMDRFGDSMKKTGKAAEEQNKKLRDLEAKQASFNAYEAQQKKVLETAKAFSAARAEVEALAKAHKKDGTLESGKALDAARQKVKDLSTSYREQSETLKTMRSSLQEAGIDTRNLSEEQKKLAEKIERTSKGALGMFAKKLSGVLSPLKKATAAVKKFADASGLTKFGRIMSTLGGVSVRALGETARHFRSVGNAIGWTIGKAAKYTTIVGGAVTAVGASVFGLAKSAANAGDAAIKAAQRAGMSVEAFQELAYAANKADVPTDALVTTMGRFSKNVGAALRGDKKMVAWFKGFGIDTKELQANLSTPEKLLSKIADGFKKANPAKEFKKAEVAMAGFGKSGQDLIPLLNSGVEGINDEIEKFRKYGHTFTEEQAREAERLNDNLSDLHATIKGVKDAIGIELAPVIADLVKAFSDWMSENKGAWLEKFREWIKDLREKIPDFRAMIEKVAATFDRWIETIAKIVDKVGGLQGVLTGFAAYFAGNFLLNLGKGIAGLKNVHDALFGVKNLMTGVSGGTTAAAGGAKAATAGGGALAGAGTVALGAAGITGALYLADRYTKAHNELRDANDREAEAHDKESQAKLVEVIAKTSKTGYEDYDLSGLDQRFADVAQRVLERNRTAFVDGLMPVVQALNRQREGTGEKPVARDDVVTWGKVIAEAVNGSEEAMKKLPAQLQAVIQNRPVVVQVNGNAEIGKRALGGLIRTPEVSMLGEEYREEAVVPLTKPQRALPLLMYSIQKIGKKLGGPVQKLGKSRSSPAVASAMPSVSGVGVTAVSEMFSARHVSRPSEPAETIRMPGTGPVEAGPEDGSVFSRLARALSSRERLPGTYGMPAIAGTGPVGEQGKAHIEVEFKNAPAGTTIETTKQKGVEVDVSRGWSRQVNPGW